MAHHAYFVEGDQNAGAVRAQRFAEQELGVTLHNSDFVTLQYGLFSVEDARELIDTAYRSSTSGKKIILASMTRLFHEAQNALLKILEEPPEGVTIILNVPSYGVLIPTLRSRLLPLPINEGDGSESSTSEIAQQFLTASSTEREKIITKLIERTKADKDETKQAARHEALELVNALTKAAYTRLHTAKDPKERVDLQAFLEDTTAYTPILYERSAPIKLIFEHLLLVIPKGLV